MTDEDTVIEKVLNDDNKESILNAAPDLLQDVLALLSRDYGKEKPSQSA